MIKDLKETIQVYEPAFVKNTISEIFTELGGNYDISRQLSDSIASTIDKFTQKLVHDFDDEGDHTHTHLVQVHVSGSEENSNFTSNTTTDVLSSLPQTKLASKFLNSLLGSDFLHLANISNIETSPKGNVSDVDTRRIVKRAVIVDEDFPSRNATIHNSIDLDDAIYSDQTKNLTPNKDYKETTQKYQPSQLASQFPNSLHGNDFLHLTNIPTIETSRNGNVSDVHTGRIVKRAVVNDEDSSPRNPTVPSSIDNDDAIYPNQTKYSTSNNETSQVYQPAYIIKTISEIFTKFDGNEDLFRQLSDTIVSTIDRFTQNIVLNFDDDDHTHDHFAVHVSESAENKTFTSGNISEVSSPMQQQQLASQFPNSLHGNDFLHLTNIPTIERSRNGNVSDVHTGRIVKRAVINDEDSSSRNATVSSSIDNDDAIYANQTKYSTSNNETSQVYQPAYIINTISEIFTKFDGNEDLFRQLSDTIVSTIDKFTQNIVLDFEDEDDHTHDHFEVHVSGLRQLASLFPHLLQGSDFLHLSNIPTIETSRNGNVSDGHTGRIVKRAAVHDEDSLSQNATVLNATNIDDAIFPNKKNTFTSNIKYQTNVQKNTHNKTDFVDEERDDAGDVRASLFHVSTTDNAPNKTTGIENPESTVEEGKNTTLSSSRNNISDFADVIPDKDQNVLPGDSLLRNAPLHVPVAFPSNGGTYRRLFSDESRHRRSASYCTKQNVVLAMAVHQGRTLDLACNP
uniref:Filamentous growth regulator 23-like n=1 Tax=Saccoglossus kowalevskii TaxID=10224 RepID=A0ABM0MZZ0_SACKO